MDVFLMLFVLLINHKLYVELTRSVCSAKRSTLYKGKLVYYTHYFCCRNFEERQGQCLECEIGYTTFNEQICQRCPENKFGRKCTSTCFCTKHESCDNIYGCKSNKIYSEFAYTYDTLNTTSWDNQTVLNMEIQNDKSDQWQVITNICIGILSLILIVTGIICFVRSRQTIQHKPQTNAFQVNSTDEPQYEHSYDEIEDQNVSELPISELKHQPNERLDHKSFVQKKTGILTNTNGGYLQPFYCPSNETFIDNSAGLLKTDDVLSEISTSEDDQGYQKVAESSKHKVEDFKGQPTVVYFEPLDISNDIKNHSVIVKHNISNITLTNTEAEGYNSNNEQDKRSKSFRQEHIQLYENTISEDEQSTIPNVFSYC